MSDPAPSLQGSIAAARSPGGGATHSAIAQAAQQTGVDFSYLLAQARIESGLNPQAQARTSSATGLYQFIDQTWLATMDRHGEELGFGQLAQAIDTSGGRARITDPAMRDAIMGLRLDPQASALMAGALANDNRAALSPVLGREPDASELYLAHFLGADGASRFLTTLGDNPQASAAAILPRAARANRAIFYDPGGGARSVSAVMDLVRGRVQTAMSSSTPAPSDPPSGWYPVQGAATPPGVRRAPAVTAMSVPGMPSMPSVNSMADTLRSSFALGGDGGQQALPGQAHVRGAYARLQAFGL